MEIGCAHQMWLRSRRDAPKALAVMPWLSLFLCEIDYKFRITEVGD